MTVIEGVKWYLCPRCSLAFVFPHPVQGPDGRTLEVCPRCGFPLREDGDGRKDCKGD